MLILAVVAVVVLGLLSQLSLIIAVTIVFALVAAVIALLTLPHLVEEYLRHLPVLVDRMLLVREHETVGAERTPDNPLGIYTLTPERIRHLSEEETPAKRRAAETARGARFRELYAVLGLRAAVDRCGTLVITVGATKTEGVIPCDGSSSPSTTSTRT